MSGVTLQLRHASVPGAAFALTLALVAASPQTPPGVEYTNPVLAGDYPDPSVIRVGKDYWATATTAQWGPLFPILHSRDLVNWRVVGAAMARRPEWSDGSYWAPEIWHGAGQFFIYYTGRKKGGPLCVAVATASVPAGPYTDHGPLVCQDAGSIDAMPVQDEHGRLHLIWKEDGNSRKQPTLLWSQRLSDDGLRLIGSRQEVFRNDAPWEGNVVEGPFVLRRNGWFYMFYSGNACCGRACNYALGVARSRVLGGPWEKYSGNPILPGNVAWKCPGHGSIVSDDRGRDFLMYHAYSPTDSIYVGRQALLDEVTWGADGWPAINGGRGPSTRAASPYGVAERNAEYAVVDEFQTTSLAPGWQWPQDNVPSWQVEPAAGGWLALAPNSSRVMDPLGAVLARSTTTLGYVATTRLDTTGLQPGSMAGIAAFGDESHATGVAVSDGRVIVWTRSEKGRQQTVATQPPAGRTVQLRLTAVEGFRFRFSMSVDGQRWTDVGEIVEHGDLTPWDRAVRVALTAGGATGATARFDWFRLEPTEKK
jgi:xylan 1,4-beta-xylosidase